MHLDKGFEKVTLVKSYWNPQTIFFVIKQEKVCFKVYQNIEATMTNEAFTGIVNSKIFWTKIPICGMQFWDGA